MKFEVVIAIICMDITIHAKNIYCYEIAAIGIFKSLLLSTEVEGIFNVSETGVFAFFVTKEEGRFHNDLMTFINSREVNSAEPVTITSFYLFYF